MKKISSNTLHSFLIVVAFFTLHLNSNAQESTWGLKGGLNYNLSEMGLENAYNSIGDIVEGHVPNNGWHLGLTSRIFLTNSFFVQLEGLYTQSSNEISGTNNTGSNPITFSNEFNNKAAQFNIIGGLEFFRFLRAQGGLAGKLSLDEEYANTFNVFNLGYIVGAGVNLGRINLDVHYNTSFQDHEGEWNGIPLSFDNSELLFSVSFMFK